MAYFQLWRRLTPTDSDGAAQQLRTRGAIAHLSSSHFFFALSLARARVNFYEAGSGQERDSGLIGSPFYSSFHEQL